MFDFCLVNFTSYDATVSLGIRPVDNRKGLSHVMDDNRCAAGNLERQSIIEVDVCQNLAHGIVDSPLYVQQSAILCSFLSWRVFLAILARCWVRSSFTKVYDPLSRNCLFARKITSHGRLSLKRTMTGLGLVPADNFSQAVTRHNVSDANGRLDFHVSDSYHLGCRIVIFTFVDPVKPEIRVSRVLFKLIIVRFHSCQTFLELVGVFVPFL